MCRSITQLRMRDRAATEGEFDAAALQFVRKVSGYRKPSQANQRAFDRAVREISRSSRRLLDSIAVG